MATVTPEHVGFVEMSSTGAGELALRYAARQGYRATLFSRDPGARVPDGGQADVIGCETNDAAQIVAAARAAGITLTGVTTTHDFYVPQAAEVARALSLPGLEPEAALDARNKIRMRRRLQAAAPQLNPRWTAAPATADPGDIISATGLPLVGKPANANDSWGVALLRSPADVERYLRAAGEWEANDAGQDLDELVLFEQYLDGPEYSVETTQARGGARTCMGVTGKPLQHAQGHFAEADIVFPVGGPDAERARAAAYAALDALGLAIGTLHTEVRVTGGQARILEVNPRLVGDMTGSHMIEQAVGASPIAHLVEIALGRNPPWTPTRHRGAASVGVPLRRTGRFRSLDNRPEVLRLPGVCELRVMVAPGTVCHVPPHSNGDYPVRVVAAGASPDLALRQAREAAAAVRLTCEEAGA
jgi:cysteine synthase A